MSCDGHAFHHEWNQLPQAAHRQRQRSARPCLTLRRGELPSVQGGSVVLISSMPSEEPIRVVVDAGPDWVQYLVAVGTIAAVAIAGWAAFSARASAKQAVRLIQLEVDRDDRRNLETLWRQARRLSVELALEPVVLESGVNALDMRLLVLNASPDPFFRCRIRLSAGNRGWGPQLLGTLGPGEPIELMARLVDANSAEANAFVRVVDVHGNSWIADARGSLVRDSPEGVDDWIEAGREFASRSLNPAERGTIRGSTADIPIDFKAWREGVAED
jgi:hypothetical protein